MRDDEFCSRGRADKLLPFANLLEQMADAFNRAGRRNRLSVSSFSVVRRLQNNLATTRLIFGMAYCATAMLNASLLRAGVALWFG